MGAKTEGKFVIGPAGKNLVRYAGVVSQGAHSGRNGVGAVFGNKLLKGIVAGGSFKPEIAEPEKLKELIKKWVKHLTEHPLTGKQLPNYGTAGLITPMNFKNLLATRNYKDGRYEGFRENQRRNIKGKVPCKK